MKIDTLWVIGKRGLEDSIKDFKHVARKHFNLNEKKPDIVATIGGEGTIFRAIKEYPDSAILPFRKLSFAALSKLDLTDVSKVLEKIKRNEFFVEKVVRLEARYKKFRIWGINDIVIQRDDESANRFRIFSKGKDIYGDVLIGDGVIIATPYGSTGYNWTAGGPILREDERKFVVTPISSSYFNKRLSLKSRRVMKRVKNSKIFSDDKEIVINFLRDIRNKIVADGRKEERLYINVKSGDKILVKKSNEYSKFIRF